MSDWQPIETAPPRENVILFVPAVQRQSYRLPEETVIGYARGYPRATHWMPLPAPPDNQ